MMKDKEVVVLNKLIDECISFMKGADFPFFICGGFALELFLDKRIRPHSDIDVCVLSKNKKETVEYMQNKHWNLYEPIGDSLLRPILNTDREQISRLRFFFCIKPNCSFININPTSKNNIYKFEILNEEQLSFDFIEVIFNECQNENFICYPDKNVVRKFDKAVLYNNDIPYIAPEILLFFKSNSAYSSRTDYQIDFNEVAPHLPRESRVWLINALAKVYDQGHPWIDSLKNIR